MSLYGEIPEYLEPFLEAPELVRLKRVGMNCGCEYTSFPRFRSLPSYSRYEHSLGCALIVHRFTGDPAQTLSALFHDIATPAFAHTVDFLRGDYLSQESTESGTERILRESAVITQALAPLGIPVDAVSDYHRYPVADNDAPRLSSDRLEYTLGNARNYGFRGEGELMRYYEDLCVIPAEDGAPELAFRTPELARAFALDAIRCARVYVSAEDRYAMQRLAELLRSALERGTVTERELWLTEQELVAKLCADPVSRADWARYRALSRMVTGESVPEELRRVIPAKKRFIDPLAAGEGRVSGFDAGYRAERDRFLAESQEEWIAAV